MDQYLTLDEAKSLDNIINIVIAEGKISIADLPKMLSKTGNNYLDYDFFLSKLENDNLIEIIPFGKTSTTIHSRDHITEKFYKKGGYISIFYEQQIEIKKQQEIDELTINKLRWDSKLSKWQANTFWYVFIFGLIGGICGIISLILSFYK